ncbi:MAG: zeta toxin family protein, partial [Bacteroidia bacterium]
NNIAEEYGALILDADYAKRKLPEFLSLPFGATLVHEESLEIIFGEESGNGYESLLQKAIAWNINLVIPKIGNKTSGIIDLCTLLEKYGYQSHLTLISVDRKIATKRALQRFIDSRRYVPLGLIFDDYSNNPTISYFTLKRDFASKIATFGLINTEKSIPQRIEFQSGNPSEKY